MLAKVITARKHFIALRHGEFENRQFSIGEALIEIYYEFFT
jgi:hypothetical protein